MRHTFWQTFKVCQSFFTLHLPQVPPLAQACSLCLIQNSEFRIPHTSPKSQKSYPSHQFKIQNSEFRIPHTSPKSQKSYPSHQFKIQNSEFKIQNSKFKIILYLCPLKGNTTFFEDEYHNKNKIQLS